MKLCMFRTVHLSIIRSLFTVHSAMVYAIQVCRQLSSRTRMSQDGTSWSCSTPVYKPVWHIPVPSVQWINSWRWTDKLSETCRFSWQNKFVKSVHLVGFITKKYVTMHGHMNIKIGFLHPHIKMCWGMYSVSNILCSFLIWHEQSSEMQYLSNEPLSELFRTEPWSHVCDVALCAFGTWVEIFQRNLLPPSSKVFRLGLGRFLQVLVPLNNTVAYLTLP